MKRGEVRWYRFAAPDKRRPVLILSRDSSLDYLNEVTVAPITSVVRDIPSEVQLSKEDGMTRKCAINLDHLQTVGKRKLGPILTTLGPHKWEEVRSALLFALGFKETL